LFGLSGLGAGAKTTTCREWKGGWN